MDKLLNDSDDRSPEEERKLGNRRRQLILGGSAENLSKEKFGNKNGCAGAQRSVSETNYLEGCLKTMLRGRGGSGAAHTSSP